MVGTQEQPVPLDASGPLPRQRDGQFASLADLPPDRAWENLRKSLGEWLKDNSIPRNVRQLPVLLVCPVGSSVDAFIQKVREVLEAGLEGYPQTSVDVKNVYRVNGLFGNNFERFINENHLVYSQVGKATYFLIITFWPSEHRDVRGWNYAVKLVRNARNTREVLDTLEGILV